LKALNRFLQNTVYFVEMFEKKALGVFFLKIIGSGARALWNGRGGLSPSENE
jgi:hypothetical protein